MKKKRQSFIIIKASIALLMMGLFIAGCSDDKTLDEGSKNLSNALSVEDTQSSLRRINLNSESASSILRSSTIPSECANEAKAARMFALNPVLQQQTCVNIGDTVDLQLFDGDRYLARISHIVVDVNGTLTLTLTLPDYPMGFALITTNTEGKSFVNVSVPETGKRFGSRCGIASNENYLIEIDADKVEHLPFGEDDIPVPAMKELSSGAPLTRAGSCGPSYNTNLDSPAEISLLVVYTPAAAATSYVSQRGGMNNVVASMIALGNLCFSNSQTGITLTLAHSVQADYTEDNNMSNSLSRLQNASDNYMDNVHDLRKQYNADLVQMLSNDSNSGGLGYVLSSTSGRYDYAFSVCYVTQVADDYPCSVHEIGHNMGLGHGAQHINRVEGLFTFSQGWRWTGTTTYIMGGISTNKKGSVMTYWSGDNYTDGKPCYIVSYFSNPNVSFEGQPTGDATQADAARSLRMMKHVVAYYSDRESIEAPKNIVVSNPTNNGATFSWDACDNATEYRFCYFIDNTIYYYTTATTSYTINRPQWFSNQCTEYEVFIQAVNDCSSTANSETIRFKTKCTTDPTVTTLAATAVTQNTATLNKTVTANGETITEEGFKYKKLTDNSWTTTADGHLTGLSSETPYKYYAYATTAAGTINGSVMTFTTYAVPVTGVEISGCPESYLNINGTVQLTATVLPANASNQSVTWISSNDAIATVSSTGLVTAKGGGTANITVKTVDGAKTASCDVMVDPHYTISASSGSNGSISPSGSVLVNYGNSQKFTFIPDAGYEVDQVMVDGVNKTSAVSQGSYTFTNVTANHSISVTFKVKQYVITASSGSNGSISPNGSVWVNHGTSQKFTFMANDGYEITQVMVDGDEITYEMVDEENNALVASQGSYTFSDVMDNHSISVAFKLSCTPNLVVQIWDDVLSVINEPANNGGYTFTFYQWQKNGVNIPGETSGNLHLTTKDYNAEYSVILTTKEGRRMESCPIKLKEL
ncbi:MAG: Ig-like domain-containing protein [Dysgonamonadaceae bacterium]|nr:Ig-like domain-containing protein [Dysgonamonadaceae bacterium]